MLYNYNNFGWNITDIFCFKLQAESLMKDYVPGLVEESNKMVVFMCILEHSLATGDRILVFSQSLFTLTLIEQFLQKRQVPGRQERWAKNKNYFRK